jgi:hypothetical protein
MCIGHWPHCFHTSDSQLTKQKKKRKSDLPVIVLTSFCTTAKSSTVLALKSVPAITIVSPTRQSTAVERVMVVAPKRVEN